MDGLEFPFIYGFGHRIRSWIFSRLNLFYIYQDIKIWKDFRSWRERLHMTSQGGRQAHRRSCIVEKATCAIDVAETHQACSTEICWFRMKKDVWLTNWRPPSSIDQVSLLVLGLRASPYVAWHISPGPFLLLDRGGMRKVLILLRHSDSEDLSARPPIRIAVQWLAGFFD